MASIPSQLMSADITAITVTLILSIIFRPLFLFVYELHRCNSVFFLFSYRQERIRLIRSNGKALNSNLDKLVIYARTVFLTAEDGRIQLQTDYKPDKTYFLCCQFPNGFTSDVAQIDTNGLIIVDYIYAQNATEKFSGDLWVSLCGVFKIK